MITEARPKSLEILACNRQLDHTDPLGGVAERLKAHAWKACVGKNLPRVRIPPPPPVTLLISS